MTLPEIVTHTAQALLAVSGLIALVGSIGLNRLPEAYTRAHAGTMITVGGVLFGLLCLALIAIAGHSIPPQKILFVMLIIAVGAPASTHATFRSATRKNVKPAIAWRNDLKEEMQE